MNYQVLDSIWREGYHSYLEGCYVYDCPFEEESPEYYEWMSGFEDAEEDYGYDAEEDYIYDEY
jgi:hypothetical protein